MVDRVSATITIGGLITGAGLRDLLDLIDVEGLSADWEGEAFSLSDLVEGEPLKVMAHEVAWGRFDELERFCVRESLPFVRWSGSCAGQWGAERVVFRGVGDPVSYPCDEDDDIVVGRQQLERLGTFDEAMAYFDAADFAVPPFRTA